jgi:hypothetical protein
MRQVGWRHYPAVPLYGVELKQVTISDIVIDAIGKDKGSPHAR